MNLWEFSRGRTLPSCSDLSFSSHLSRPIIHKSQTLFVQRFFPKVCMCRFCGDILVTHTCQLTFRFLGLDFPSTLASVFSFPAQSFWPLLSIDIMFFWKTRNKADIPGLLHIEDGSIITKRVEIKAADREEIMHPHSLESTFSLVKDRQKAITKRCL